MLAEDLKPNRLLALKAIASNFIDKRPKDLIGLTIYAGDSFTQCPLTNDHSLLKSLLYDASSEWLADGTAIGMGLASAVNRLKESGTEGKVIVLMTDGENNAGTIDPFKAAELAQKYKIKLYTIGIGTEGMAPFPIYDNHGQKEYYNVPVSIDEPLLKSIAQRTNGNYFRAKSNKDLEAIYQKIDILQSSKPQVKSYLSLEDWHLPFTVAAFGLLLTEIVLKYTLLRSFT
ncbi:hypothetical protein AAE02nite_18210 [Adhaeribacter aerolatus]|uniref:VWFA domain-containing protein n=2 Tax=Adhaeribacter aerolatus TaxID=670289 RepID=A0A512AXB7_9BACT|nr:hypothetical protein AAE02nite_18210 [Adhaeribacter aerolatus]